MTQESREALRRFEQKIRDQGSDGFADGPRPWEHWDESGHQANNRIWEGSARRVYPGRRKIRSLGYRLLSVLAFLALTTLLVGIGGVYYSHTQNQQLAQNSAQPLPATRRPDPTMTSTDADSVITATTSAMDELSVLSAPAAGPASTQDQLDLAVATAPATDELMQETATTETPATAAQITPPLTNDSIDSVAIETVVTKQSVTTTVYTRHPQQDEAEIVAAIETTPPPFAHAVTADPQQVSDGLPPAVHISNAEAMTAAASATTTDTTDRDQLDTATDTSSTELTEPATTVALAETDNEAADNGTLAATLAQRTALPDTPPAEQAEEATAVDATDRTTAIAVAESAVESDTEIPDEPGNVLPDTAAVEMTTVEPVAETATVAVADSNSATSAPEVTPDQDIDNVVTVTPVVKTGNWVINLASYTWKSTAGRKLALFQSQGVDAEIFKVMINDKPMYRVRVTGFESSGEAKAEIPTVEKKLNLEGAWISKR